MAKNKGITLIEIIVTFVIIAIIAAVVVPNLATYMQQAGSKAAQNNLIAIYNAQKSYYFANGTYCTTSSPSSGTCGGSTCADSLANINCNLSLDVTDTNFTTYKCTSASGFTCTAKNSTAATFTLTVTGPLTNPIIVPGGTGCTGGSLTPPTACNPYCTYAAHPSYCPSTSN